MLHSPTIQTGIVTRDSWNKNLAYQRALYMGGEFRAKGVNIALGPVVGPLGRVAEGGRNWEGFSNDPYLCGSLAAETVRGIQQNGVITSTKVVHLSSLISLPCGLIRS
jgi:beta-glucosidase